MNFTHTSGLQCPFWGMNKNPFKTMCFCYTGSGVVLLESFWSVRCDSFNWKINDLRLVPSYNDSKKGTPKEPIAERKNRLKPVVPKGGIFLTHSHILLSCFLSTSGRLPLKKKGLSTLWPNEPISLADEFYKKPMPGLVWSTVCCILRATCPFSKSQEQVPPGHS